MQHIIEVTNKNVSLCHLLRALMLTPMGHGEYLTGGREILRIPDLPKKGQTIKIYCRGEEESKELLRQFLLCSDDARVVSKREPSDDLADIENAKKAVSDAELQEAFKWRSTLPAKELRFLARIVEASFAPPQG